MVQGATKIRLEAFGKQADFIFDEAPFAAAISGIGGGKSLGGAIKALKYMVDHPGSFGMVTAPSYPMLQDATMRSVREVFPDGSYEEKVGEKRIVMNNGSELVFRTTDDPNHLRGPNLAWVWMDEAFQGTTTNADSQYDAFLILQGRVRQVGYPHQLWITGTPNGYNWGYRVFVLNKSEDYKLYQWSSRENPYLTPAFIRHLEESYTDKFSLQEIDGQFVVVAGNAYFSHTHLADMLDDCREPVDELYGGLVKIWRKPAVAGRYVVGGDVAWGEKGAYSCVPLADWQTGEQFAEIYGRPDADELAQRIVEVCKYYNDAYVGIEANGEGMNVVNKMVALGYGTRMYHRGDEWRRNERQRGWHTGGGNSGTRAVMLGELEEEVRVMGIRPRCIDAVREMMAFVRDDSGKPMASAGMYSDHVMSWAILNKMRKFAKWPSLHRGSVQRPRMW